MNDMNESYLDTLDEIDTTLLLSIKRRCSKYQLFTEWLICFLLTGKNAPVDNSVIQEFTTGLIAIPSFKHLAKTTNGNHAKTIFTLYRLLYLVGPILPITSEASKARLEVLNLKISQIEKYRDEGGGVNPKELENLKLDSKTMQKATDNNKDYYSKFSPTVEQIHNTLSLPLRKLNRDLTNIFRALPTFFIQQLTKDSLTSAYTTLNYAYELLKLDSTNTLAETAGYAYLVSSFMQEPTPNIVIVNLYNRCSDVSDKTEFLEIILFLTIKLFHGKSNIVFYTGTRHGSWDTIVFNKEEILAEEKIAKLIESFTFRSSRSMLKFPDLTKEDMVVDFSCNADNYFNVKYKTALLAQHFDTITFDLTDKLKFKRFFSATLTEIRNAYRQSE